MSRGKVYIPQMTENVSEYEKNVVYSENNILIEKLELFKDFAISLHFNIKNSYFGPEFISSDEIVTQHFSWAFKTTVKEYKKLGFHFSNTKDLETLFKAAYRSHFYGDKPTGLDLNKYWKNLMSYGKKLRGDMEMMVRLYRMFDKSLS